MTQSPASALTERYGALLSEGPLDVPACRRLALWPTRTFPDPDNAAWLQEVPCSAIDVHADDPVDARERFELLRPAIESLATASH